jgi:acyl-coenzyme A thioesterase PaaI-like protein
MISHTLPDGFKPLPVLSSSSCFGCGSGNALGLRMKFCSDGRSVASSLVVPEHLCGWRQVVHGGIVATILDEIMGWSAIYLMKKVALTKRLTVDYLKPTPVNQALFVEGRVADQPDARHVVIQAAIHTPDNEISARSEGLFTLFPLDDPVSLGLLGPEMVGEIRTGFLLDQT